MALHKCMLFTGAGASSCFGFPTTEQFITSLKTELSKRNLDDVFAQQSSESLLLTQILAINEFKDVEHVLELLDLINSVNKPRFLYFINKYNASFSGLGSVNSSLDFRVLLRIANNLRSKIQQDIFRQYEFNPSVIPKINETYVPLLDKLAYLNGDGQLAVFTTNYDQVIENACSNDFHLIDGFERKDKRADECEWTPEQYDKKSHIETNSHLPIIRLFKLHGSLNWRERIVDGKTVRVSTEELTNGSKRYRKNYVIYPAEKVKPENEPFRKLHELFINEYLDCDTAIFLGFKFRDDYINSVINQGMSNKQVIVISPHASEFVQNNREKFNPTLTAIDHAFGNEPEKLLQKLEKAIMK